MFNLKTIAAVAALSLGTVGAAQADTGLGAVSSAWSLSFQTVPSSGELAVRSGRGLASEQVDLDSLKARISNNAKFMDQLQNYGATIDDVIGINATSESDVTILVRG
jgi:hypothetical protein